MGNQQSEPTPRRSKPQSSEASIVRELVNDHYLTPRQAQQISEMPASEKRHLYSVLKKEEQQFHDALQQVVDTAKSKIDHDKGKLKNMKLSTKQKSDIIEGGKLTQVQKLYKQKKQLQASTIKNQINKEEHACDIWQRNKKDEKPKNPLSNRPISKSKSTYHLLNRICNNKKKICQQPNKSIFDKSVTYKADSKTKKIISEICLPVKKNKPKK